MHVLLKTAFLALPILHAAAGSGRAQSVIGHVLDAATNAPLQGAEVRLLAENEVQQRVLSDSTGFFRLLAPLPGSYVIEAELLGFERSRSSPLELPVSRELNVEVRLSRTAIPRADTRHRGSQLWHPALRVLPPR